MPRKLPRDDVPRSLRRPRAQAGPEGLPGSVGLDEGGRDHLVAALQATLDRVAEGVVVCDMAGTELYRNRRASGLVPSRLDEALVTETIQERLGEACRGISSESAVELFSSRRRTLVVRAFPLNGEDGPLGAAAIVEDASERQRIDAIRRDFVANVSHELKTPVGALSLLAETLEEEDDPEVISRLSQRVGTETERLGRIIDDLLDLSRIEVNEGSEPEEVALAELIDEVLDPLRPLARAQDIVLEVGTVDPGLTLLCDRRDVVSAISNLVDNAIKYSEKEGQVCVRAGRGTDGYIEVSVSDLGIGIPQRDSERIFERFYRVDRARSRSTGGTGLGLAIVRHVAVNHGGSVTVKSTEGEGSTFTLRLASARPQRLLTDRKEDDG